MSRWQKYGSRGGFLVTDRFYRLLITDETVKNGDMQISHDGEIEEIIVPDGTHFIHDAENELPIIREIKSFEDL